MTSIDEVLTVTTVRDSLRNTDGVTDVAVSSHDDYYVFEGRFEEAITADDEARVRTRFEAYGPTIKTGERNDGTPYISLRISGLIDDR